MEEDVKMTFRITNAEIKGDEVIVYASFFAGEEMVKAICHAFPKTLTKEEIEDEVQKVMELFVAEQIQAESQAVVDEETEKDRNLINSLITK